MDWSPPAGATVVERAGRAVALTGGALALLLIGHSKFAEFEVEALKPLIGGTPWLARMYAVSGPVGVSRFLGVMRKIIAALQVSLDGFIEGPNAELDWVDSWEDSFDIVGNVDAFILGARMYPGYEEYWQAVLGNPRGILPFTGRPATGGEIEYAEFAGRTRHIVVSRTLQTLVEEHENRSGP